MTISPNRANVDLECAMSQIDSTQPPNANVPKGMRLVWVIILETLIVAVAGLAVWGVAWDLGYPTAGLVVAIVIWVVVSPAIEIATVVSVRRASTEMPGDPPSQHR